MPKAEGYTYEKDGVKKDVYYSQLLNSDNDKAILTNYSALTQQIRGDKFLTSTGMLRAAPEGYFTYSGSTYRYGGISDIAQEGTAVIGGTPNIKYTRDDNSNSEKITLSLNDNGTLTLTDGDGLIRKNYNYIPGINFIKIWIAATGGGGGAGGRGGNGGGGGAFALFPAIVEKGIKLVITCGKAGHGGDDPGKNYRGDAGGATFIKAITSNNTSYTVAELYGGGGGTGSTYNTTYTAGGSAYVYREAPPSWLNCLGVNSLNELKATSHGSTQDLLNPFNFSSNLLCVIACGGRGGSCGYSVENPTGERGDSRNMFAGYISASRDYNYPYFKSAWTSYGGNVFYDGSRFSSGGGASAFYESYGASGNKGASSGERNGYLGGGGSSGDGNSGGGWGGFGAADIWIAGVTDSSIVSIGTRNSTSGGEVTDNYPSGKDVTDEITVTFKNATGVGSDTVNTATFSSASIPSNKSVKLSYILTTANRDDYSKTYTTSVNTSTTLPYTYNYSSTNREFTGNIQSKSATIV